MTMPAATELGSTSPFAPVGLPGAAAELYPQAPPPGQVLASPFAEAAMAADDGRQAGEAAGALLAELDDARFTEAVEAVADTAAARQLRSVATWSSDSAAPALATADTTAWLEQLAAEADRMLGALEAHFGDRPAESLRDGELESVAGLDGWTDPTGAQELFLGGLLNKARKLAAGVGKLAQKGLAVVGSLALGPLFGLLRKLVRPLLSKVLDSAIGKLPESVRPLATQLAAKLKGETDLLYGPIAGLAETFDRTLAEAATGGDAGQSVAELEQPGSYPGGATDGSALDAARTQLAGELTEAEPGVPPTAQLEQFIPVVMAALPLIRTGIKLIGRDRIVTGIAKPLSALISGIVGADAANLLSRHIAGAGLGLLGLEAAGDPATLGGEALVAATEDTVRQVLTLPPASLENELLLETEVQDAFAAATARHLPAAVLRPELTERELDGESGVWVFMPRVTRPCFRYKKYSRVIPVRVSRPVARSVLLAGGDTLERRLLDAGAESWPVDGEVELYELLPGGGLGQLAAFESPDGADAPALAAREFEELTAEAATLLAGSPRFAQSGRYGRPGGHRHAGSRYFRFRYRGRPLHHRPVFGFRLDLTATQPVVAVTLPIGERAAHDLAGHLERRRLVQVMSLLRGLLDRAVLAAMGRRLEHLLARHEIAATTGAGQQLAETLADGMLRAVSAQLPAAAAALAAAAKDPAPGVTLTFAFAFADRAALAAGTPTGDPTVTFRPGQHRD
jgi:hypothetical protein